MEKDRGGGEKERGGEAEDEAERAVTVIENTGST